jgi:hypothetical protein
MPVQPSNSVAAQVDENRNVMCTVSAKLDTGTVPALNRALPENVSPVF